MAGDETFEDIINRERDLVFAANKDYGEFFANAGNMTSLMNGFIKSIDAPEKYIFIVFLSQVKKHLTLALFSAVRLHHVQTGMDIRQALEAGAWAAYAMAHDDPDHFRLVTADGGIEIPTKLAHAKNEWLNQHFNKMSDAIKRQKQMINNSVAHTNLAYAFNNFKMKPADDPGFVTPFFDEYATDAEREFRVKTNLWWIANVAMGLMDLFAQVNQSHHVFQLRDDFNVRFGELITQNVTLKDQMMKDERFREMQ
jgi:hypothetical protein